MLTYAVEMAASGREAKVIPTAAIFTRCWGAGAVAQWGMSWGGCFLGGFLVVLVFLIKAVSLLKTQFIFYIAPSHPLIITLIKKIYIGAFLLK